MKNAKSVLLLTALFTVLFALSSCSFNSGPEPVSRTDVAMGSVVNVKVYGDETAQSVSDEVIAEIKNLDLVISKNDENAELYKLNQKGGETVKASDELTDIIGQTKEIYSRSGGRLSVTSGALTELWGFDTDEFKLPTDSDIKNAIPLCDDTQLVIDKDGKTVTLPEGRIINLGSVGKGAACQKAAAVFEKSDGCKGMIISVGGSVGVFGSHGEKESWTVGIRDPYGDVNSYCATLTVDGGSYISTSGSYEKNFEKDGKTYHHILDLRTGYPAETELVSVSVKADSGLLSDALSTMCFVLGEEESKAVLDSYNAQAVFVYADKSVSITDGARDTFKIANGEYSLR